MRLVLLELLEPILAVLRLEDLQLVGGEHRLTREQRPEHLPILAAVIHQQNAK